MQDESAIHRLKRHCPDAWAVFYDRHVGEVWRFMHRRTGSRTDADDLAAETFLAAVEAIAQCDPAAGTAAQWLFGIARHKLADHLRKRVHRRLIGELLDEPAAPLESPSVDVERVAAVLNAMPPPHRQVLDWKYHQGLSVQEIAGRLNRTEKAAENLLRRARERFRLMYRQPAVRKAAP